MNTTKKLLKEEIKSLVAESVEARKAIHASHGMARWNAWQDKRGIGAATRDVYLALAFVRKVPYRVLEKKCLEDSLPSYSYARMYFARDIHAALLRAEPESKVCIEDIKDWLAVPASITEETVVASSKEEAAE